MGQKVSLCFPKYCRLTYCVQISATDCTFSRLGAYSIRCSVTPGARKYWNFKRSIFNAAYVTNLANDKSSTVLSITIAPNVTWRAEYWSSITEDTVKIAIIRQFIRIPQISRGNRTVDFLQRFFFRSGYTPKEDPMSAKRKRRDAKGRGSRDRSVRLKTKAFRTRPEALSRVDFSLKRERAEGFRCKRIDDVSTARRV